MMDANPAPDTPARNANWRAAVSQASRSTHRSRISCRMFNSTFYVPGATKFSAIISTAGPAGTGIAATTATAFYAHCPTAGITMASCAVGSVEYANATSAADSYEPSSSTATMSPHLSSRGAVAAPTNSSSKSISIFFLLPRAIIYLLYLFLYLLSLSVLCFLCMSGVASAQAGHQAKTSLGKRKMPQGT